jgi:predicted enzyme related to lactoylglutathione lyase
LLKDGDELQEGWKHHPRQYVYFAVSDLDATHQQAVAAGGTIMEGGIQKMPWGERMFWAKDPFGNPISFVDEKTLFHRVSPRSAMIWQRLGIANCLFLGL